MELIEREIKAKKTNFLEDYQKIQIAFNSFGHLTIRFFKDYQWHLNDKGERVKDLPKDGKDKDLLVVFTAEQTREILRFATRIQNRYGDC